MVSSPLSGRSKRLMHLRVVDLPDPEGSMMATVSPLFTERSMLFSIVLSPNFFLRLWSLIMVNLPYMWTGVAVFLPRICSTLFWRDVSPMLGSP